MKIKIIAVVLVLYGCIAQVWALSSLDAEISLHLSLLHGKQGDYTGESMYDIDHAQALLDEDIGALLSSSSDPERALSAHIGQLQTSLRTQSINQQILRLKRDEELAKRKQCTTQKKSSDREFYIAISQGASDASLDQIATQSAAHGSCAEQARIKARAYTLMLQQIEGYVQKLTRRIRILQSNETFLIQHRDLINSDPTTIIQVNRLINELQ